MPPATAGAITGGGVRGDEQRGLPRQNMIIILNDNQQVSFPTQYNSLNQDPWAPPSTPARLQSKPSRAARAPRRSPRRCRCQQEVTAKVDEYARGMSAAAADALGVGQASASVDGHNLKDLVAILQEVKATAPCPADHRHREGAGTRTWIRRISTTAWRSSTSRAGSRRRRAAGSPRTRCSPTRSSAARARRTSSPCRGDGAAPPATGKYYADRVRRRHRGATR